ncbi:hypothetical protein [Belnapia rosea]|uniref:hypothetical protein n=1 Tax=Belnapia rosea TaxID=938405 RepID=UPI00115FFFF9|nr:hypothetical protein [Belnapia rosea]
MPDESDRPAEVDQFLEVDLADLADALYHALSFDQQGKPRAWQQRIDALTTAEWQARHLLTSQFVVLRRARGVRLMGGPSAPAKAPRGS